MENVNEVVILIPALNPDKKLVTLINALLKNEFYDIIIVNDGSNERFENIFEECSKQNDKIKIIKHAVNLGKGRALKTGINFYLNYYKNKIGIITVDADGQHRVDDIIHIAQKMKDSETQREMILGSRNFETKNVPFKSRYGNKITRQVFSFLTGIKVKDTQTGLRGIFNYQLKKILDIYGEKFEYEMNMLMACNDYDLNIIEIPIETIYIEGNSSSHFNPLKDAVRIYLTFFKYIFSSIISFVIDILLYKILFDIFQRSIPIYAIAIATIGARIVSSLVNYKINKDKVFKNADKLSLLKYYTLCGIQMLISAISVTLLFNYIKTGEVFIKIFVDIILFFINFKIQKEWVFRKEK